MRRRTARQPVSRFMSTLRAFAADCSGATIVMFVVLIPVLIAAVGMAVDLSASYLVRQRLGGALDAAALAATASETDPDRISQRVEEFFASNYPDYRLGITRDLTTLVDSANDTVTVSAYADYKTSFMWIVGINQITVYRTTTVKRQVQGLEVVMVLDNTGSMTDANKIGALRTAATDLVNILFSKADDPEHIKIGMVPYANSVRVGRYGVGLNPDGTVYENSDGTAVTPFVTLPAGINYTTNLTSGSGWYGCVIEHNPTDPQDAGTAMIAGSRGQLWTSAAHPYAAHGWNPAVTNNDDYPQDVSDDYTGPWDIYSYGTVTQNLTCAQYNCRTYWPAGPTHYGACRTYYSGSPVNSTTCQTFGPPTYSYSANSQPNRYCPSANVQALSSDQAVLLADIQGMQAGGNTRGDIGAMWGYRVISPDAPFTEGASWTDKDWRKAVIMMTDGMNTKDGTYAGDWFQSRTQKDVTEYNQRFSEVCTKLKNQGVVVYTIILGTNGAFPEPDQATKDLYRDCATDASKYFDSQSNQALIDAFNTMANQLANLHISQ